MVLAEAMLLGRAAISTNWSVNVDFMDETSAAMVAYRMIPAVDPRGVFQASGAVWAEADLGAAVTHLTLLADDPIARATLAGAGRVMAQQRLGTAPLAAALRGIGLAF